MKAATKQEIAAAATGTGQDAVGKACRDAVTALDSDRNHAVITVAFR